LIVVTETKLFRRWLLKFGGHGFPEALQAVSGVLFFYFVRQGAQQAHFSGCKSRLIFKTWLTSSIFSDERVPSFLTRRDLSTVRICAALTALSLSKPPSPASNLTRKG
jgi:hypothetical protein